MDGWTDGRMGGWRINLALLLLAGCGATATPPPTGTPIRLTQVAQGIPGPVYLTAPPGDPRLFIVEQQGRIRIVKDGTLLPAPFLDIQAKVLDGGERGLLSMAFHPQYAQNGFFYVNYTDVAGNTRIERYHVGATPDIADPASAFLVLGFVQPYSNHNGGHVLFGPDGMLYIPTGDGGSGGDPQNRAQNPDSLLGKLLRINVDGGSPYAIPPDNPFATGGGRGEIWAIGLRNPWRAAFDSAAGLLYIADVGQNVWEEVNVQLAAAAGINYGWRIMEGQHCYFPNPCTPTGVLPEVEYSHGDGCSITGGYVYRGSAAPSLVGHYFYADYCEGWIRSFRFVNGAVTEHQTRMASSVGNVTSFGEDAAGELYVVTAQGRVYRIGE